MNTITVIGRLTKDPEIKYQDNGNAVTTLAIADNKKVKGEQVTLFFDCTIWGKRGETAAEYLKKGQTVAVVGTLEPPRVHEGKAYLKVTAHDFTLSLGGGEERQPAAAGRAQAPAATEEIPF